jgi:hypothetical protein
MNWDGKKEADEEGEEAMSKMNSPNCTCKTTKMCFLHGTVPKERGTQKAPKVVREGVRRKR